MAPLIDANATTAAELFTKDKALQFRVPAFQRPFSWNKGNVSDLWDDLRDAITHDRKHFLGSVVLQSNNSKRSTIVEIFDGQQRLTVVMALVAVIRHACQSIAANVSNDRKLAHRCCKLVDATEELIFVKRKSRRQLRLRLSEDDHGYFNGCIQNSALAEMKTKSNKFLRSHVFQNLTTKLAESQSKSSTCAEQIDYLETLLGDVLNRLYFVSICVDKAFSEATLFETLNVRGNPLKGATGLPRGGF